MSQARPAVLVVVPAKDEAEQIALCLDSVATALHHAEQEIGLRWAGIAVASHLSVDNTAEVAEEVLKSHPEFEQLVSCDQTSTTVGEVRHALVCAAGAQWNLSNRFPAAWLFSTDADSLVPEDWITETLTTASRTGAEVVVGMVDLHDPPEDLALLSRYDDLVSRGLHQNGHHHVYAANLALRLRLYFELGGFPSVAHGEEHALVEAARQARASIVTPLSPRVRTSARMPGRAEHGLGALLHSLRSPNG